AEAREQVKNRFGSISRTLRRIYVGKAILREIPFALIEAFFLAGNFFLPLSTVESAFEIACKTHVVNYVCGFLEEVAMEKSVELKVNGKLCKLPVIEGTE